MGCGNSSPQEVDDLSAGDMKKKDKMLESELNEDRKKDRGTKKLLLLGPGNSGKSTFFKQLLQIHGDGFTEKHMIDARKSVYDSILTQMKFIIQQARELKLELNKESIEAIEFIEELPRDIEINKEIAEYIEKLWSDKNIKKAYDERSNLAIVDSTPHFLDDIERIGKSDYKPTKQDILLVRTPTTGVTENSFTINDHTFRIFDVGGQRSERSKWIHCFDTVTAVLFVCSLSCYDQYLFEDVNVNAMHEALDLFSEVCNSRWFKKTSMILFMNKSDLFKIKIQKKSLDVCWPDYKGNSDDVERVYNESIDYIRSKFIERNINSSSKQIYSHVTCATNRGDVERVFNDVQHMVVNLSLKRGGLL